MTTYKDAVGTNIGENVLLGKTPTFSGWTVDPSVNIGRLTDGSLATSMTSGSNNLTGAWDYCYIDFDVPNGIYLVGCYGKVDCAAANGAFYAVTSTNKQPQSVLLYDVERFGDAAVVMVDDGVIRYGITADGASTVTPDFYELWAIRVA